MYVLSKGRYKYGGMIVLMPLFMSPMINLFSRPLKMKRVIKRFKWATKEIQVLGKDTIEIVFIFRKRITLLNVLYVPDMNRNLIGGGFLSKPSIKELFDFGKLILSKSGNFVGNW